MSLPPPSEPPRPAGPSDAASPAGGPPRAPRWQWIAVVLATLVLVGAVVVAATQIGGSDDDDEGATSTFEPAASEPTAVAASAPAGSASTASSAPVTSNAPAGTAAISSAPVVSGAPATSAPVEPTAVGDVVDLADGSSLRVDSVLPDAPTPDGVFAAPAGVTVTRVDVEGCAGADRLPVSPDAFVGFLDDIAVATRYGAGSDLIDLELAAGGCFRSTLGFEVPDGRFLKTLVAYRDDLELGRWELNLGTAPTDQLVPATAPESVALGATAGLADGATAIVRSVRPAAGASAPDTGPDLTAFVVDVQACAGTGALSVHPFNWVVVGADHRLGTNIFSPATFPATDVAPGQCVDGAVTLTLPVGSTAEYILLTDDDGVERARWATG